MRRRSANDYGGSLGAVEDTIGSNVPSLGYTITYAIGNTLLIIWGVVLVLLLA